MRALTAAVVVATRVPAPLVTAIREPTVSALQAVAVQPRRPAVLAAISARAPLAIAPQEPSAVVTVLARQTTTSPRRSSSFPARNLPPSSLNG